MSKIVLGDKAKDTVTGLVGIVIATTEFLNGCTRVGLQPQELKDGKPVAASWFDEPQLELVESGVIVTDKTKEMRAAPAKTPRTGGPMDHTPQRAADVG